MTQTRCIVGVLLIFQLVALSAFAASVSITPGAGGSFTVQGYDMDGVSGIDLNLSYSGFPEKPTDVKPGGLVSSALFAANTNAFGSIRIGIISSTPFSGSGPVATITFAKGTGNLVIVSKSMIDSNTNPINLDGTTGGTTGGSTGGTSGGTTVGTTGETSAGTTSGATSGTTYGTTGGTTPAYLGAVSMPSDTSPQQPPKQAQPVEQPPKTAPPLEQPSSPEAAAAPPREASSSEPSRTSAPMIEKAESPTHVSHTGILERFRSYEGEKSPAIFSALFNRDVATTIRQTPAIAVSDGITAVTVTFELPVSEAAPNFAINGAKLASIEKGQETGTWVIKLLPNSAVFKATLTIMSGNSGVDFPLTVIPPVNGLKFSDKDFAEFMKDSGAAKPKYDLNGDGRHDYIDNYIYSGHYLLRNQNDKKNERKDPK